MKGAKKVLESRKKEEDYVLYSTQEANNDEC